MRMHSLRKLSTRRMRCTDAFVHPVSATTASTSSRSVAMYAGLDATRRSAVVSVCGTARQCAFGSPVRQSDRGQNGGTDHRRRVDRGEVGSEHAQREGLLVGLLPRVDEPLQHVVLPPTHPVSLGLSLPILIIASQGQRHTGFPSHFSPCASILARRALTSGPMCPTARLVIAGQFVSSLRAILPNSERTAVVRDVSGSARTRELTA